ncbi:hypothetical protein CVT26_007404 [Gymnopilus dilepis]|uniref:Uncharacterized protein n=1 Tax=Gymnopilus dilepis TaxID=231916 RepID=A0A409WQA5_9AGAR|nr:hypothetical protein CVT26_007404 [Gymnopilus dilepis]
MSLRTLLDLPNYPHNCIIPLPYPVFTIDDLQHIELHALAYTLAHSKLSVTAEHALITSSRVKTLRSQQAKGRQSSLVLAIDGRADETLAMTNMSLGRLVDVDWTGVGGGKTVFQYKYLMTAGSLPFSNMVTIGGRLGDGTVALEVVLNRKRMRALEDAVARLG